MATTTNYGWTTPDDTALVKDGAAAIRTLGTSVDTTTKNLNPSTTLGDIEYRSSTSNTNTRLGIGSSGQALTVVAGVPSWAASATSVLTTTGDTLYASAANTLARLGVGSTGQVLTVAGGVPSWATPAGGGSNWSLLNSGGTALNGAATVTVSGISAKDKIMVLVSGASSANASSVVGIRLNTDTGSNYYSTTINYTFNSSYSSADFGTGAGNATSITLGTVSSDSNAGVTGSMMITGCNSSGVKVFQGFGSGRPRTGNGQVSTFSGGYYDSATVISSVSIISSSGNFDDADGKVFIYTSA